LTPACCSYLGVTEVDFISSGGTPHLAYGSGSATHFVMDNVTVAAAPAPILAIARSGSTEIVSWSAPAVGWSLQQNTNLTSATWTSPVEVVNDGGTNKFIIVNPTGASRFYRLGFQ
jgi:hypothetical protein